MGALPKVTIYTKPDCKLCVPVIEIAERVRESAPFELEKVDITSDAELTRKYGTEIPVVAVDGRKAFKGRMTEQAFRKRIDKARKSSTKAPDAAPAVEALEFLAPRPFVPQSFVTYALAAVIAVAFGYQVMQGLEDKRFGYGRISSTLLRVEAKNEAPIDFELATIDGKKMSLRDHAGKVVFINFWATWCPPCIKEMPSMRRLAKKFGDDGRFVMLAVSADEGWTPVREFFRKDPPPFNVLLDPEGKLANEYGTEKFPETYIVVDGRLVGYIIGDRDWDTWYAEAYLRSLLEHGAS